MERITQVKHPKQAFIFSLSITLERAAYYGMRALIALYMVIEIFEGSDIDAATVYSTFIASIVFGKILGSILGDLIIGNRRAIIIGAAIQALGIFTLCIPNTTGLYSGIVLMILGGGMYSPNLIAEYGKLYLDRDPLMDAGFSMFYAGVSVGSFIGVTLIAFIAETLGFSIGFVLAGIFSLLSALPIFFASKKQLPEESALDTSDVLGTPKDLEMTKSSNETSVASSQRKSFPMIQRILNILLICVAVGIFWGVNELGGQKSYEVGYQISQLSMGMLSSIVSSLGSSLSMPVALIIVFIWSFIYVNSKIRFTIGLVAGVIGFGLLYVIPESATEADLMFYILSGFFLSVAEIYISPTAFSIITRYGNPKFLALLVSGLYASISIGSYLANMIFSLLDGESNTLVLISLITLLVVAVVFSIFILVEKTKRYLPENIDD
jgi:POT family proton-dependent oligopeptide transporter